MHTQSLAIKKHFRSLKDPRRRHGRRHLLLDMVVMAVCAVTGGADNWEEIAAFGRRQEAWFRRYLSLPGGIPSHDTLARVFSRLDPQVFQRCLRDWLLAFGDVLRCQHIAIDGKTLRGSGRKTRGLGPLHTFNRQSYAQGRYEDALRHTSVANRRVMIFQGSVLPVLECITVLGLAAVLLGGVVLFRDRQQEVLTSLLGFLFILYRLLPRANNVQHQYANANSMIPATHRVANFLRTDDKEVAARGGTPIHRLERGIEFRDVSFRYRGATRDAISELTFAVPQGAMVALVGESGAGKSTISDLLLRLYDPTSGQILVDGVDLCALDAERWRACLGVVSQDSFFFHASIRENIRFGHLEATDEDIVDAARIAGAHPFVAELPKGYDTPIGDRGFRLSGGQRQQIAIARAILRDPQVLLLDEATSSLDNQSERLIQEAIERLGGRRTIVAIAHRLPTIVRADLILVLEKGHIVERGTHAELLARNGYYARLWRLQAQSTTHTQGDAETESTSDPQAA